MNIEWYKFNVFIQTSIYMSCFKCCERTLIFEVHMTFDFVLIVKFFFTIYLNIILAHILRDIL